ncbi:MAG: hypothetical protein O9302_07155 [Cyclobacteriaceae bacterium]|jgi:hypothetical protein|nr:hypothetical protein [Cytophagales bacterium]MCZ8327819.1 hypothetical protein [Cyclobacteriaceae bacterium]
MKIMLLSFLLFTFLDSNSQELFRYQNRSLSISLPLIFSKVKIKDNWTPSTAPNYKEYLGGTAFGHGFDLEYTFHPGFLIKDRHFSVNVGVGYFKQRFNIKRPFNYDSQFEPIYYTDNYLYHSWHWMGGLTYTYSFINYTLIANVSYRQLRSFQQEYTPANARSSYGFITQVNRNQFDFGKILSFDVGIRRRLGERFLIGLNIIAPVYTRWRNDSIFNDDTATFSKPEFSLGTSLNVSYNLKSKGSS